MKNSPREILLNHHREVDTRLDRMCKSLLAAEMAAEAPPPRSTPMPVFSALAGFASRAWMELVWSCRLAWTGLAAVWVLAVILDLRSFEPPPAGAPQARAGTAGNISFVLMQQRLLTELREPTPMPPPPQSGMAPQSRREDFVPNPESALALDNYECNPTDTPSAPPLPRAQALSLAV